MPRNILALLEGGDLRSIGRADEVAAAVSRNHKLFSALMHGWRSEDPVVRMRAADVTEKIPRKHLELLRTYKGELLALMDETQQQELRWHLAAIIPRLALNQKERQFAFSRLRSWLNDKSSIVKTFAMQAMADLAVADSGMRDEVIDVLQHAKRNGTPAMKARGRKLLLRFDSGE